MAFYDDRDQYGYPINIDIEIGSYGLKKSASLEGSGMLVSELIANNEKMVVPGFNAQSYQWAIEGDLTFDVDYWWDGPISVLYMMEGL